MKKPILLQKPHSTSIISSPFMHFPAFSFLLISPIFPFFAPHFLTRKRFLLEENAGWIGEAIVKQAGNVNGWEG
jgi:hypothetical protein